MGTEDDDTEPEVRTFLASTQMDKAADYSARGREYQHLALDQLREAWIRAFRAMVDAGIPGDPAIRQRERDLVSEIELRGGKPPYSDVKDAVDRYCSTVLRRVESDPDARERVIDSLEVDLAELFSRRKAKN
jgi:hypothetical protein